MAFKSISIKYRLNMDKIKEIFIRNLTTYEVRPLKISMSKTIRAKKGNRKIIQFGLFIR